MTQYEFNENDCTCKINDEGERTMLSNFTAKIERETRYRDETDTQTVLTITGKQAGEPMPELNVNADKFPSMSWVVPNWGIRAVVLPGSTIKDDLRAAIQLHSKPTKHIIYTHTGWSTNNGHNVYLHSGGGIGPDGNDDKLSVELPHELQSYHLDLDRPLKPALKCIISFLETVPPQVAWPLLATAVAPLHGPIDFATHLTGRTGTFKSELAALMQSCYGEEMDARHLPGSWSSTANALEAQSYRAKNALFCVDDFIPSGTSWQVRAYQKTADQLIRGQGNQAGRARLTDVSNLQTTMYPRGVILSTGEDTPEGHSIRARMMILEIAPGDVDIGNLTSCQNQREMFSTVFGHYIKELAPKLPEVKKSILQTTTAFRDKHIDLGHTRTPAALGRLLASLDHFMKWVAAKNGTKPQTLTATIKRAYEAMLAVANNQGQYLTAVDPCEAFCESIAHLLAAHIGHLRTKDGGIPAKPELLGWTREESLGDLPTYKSHGKTIGWVSWDNDELFIDLTTAYNDIRKHANNQITFTRQTMLKRMKDAGLLLRTDEARQRNSVRIIAEQHPRNVLAMSLSQTLNIQEKP